MANTGKERRKHSGLKNVAEGTEFHTIRWAGQKMEDFQISNWWPNPPPSHQISRVTILDRCFSHFALWLVMDLLTKWSKAGKRKNSKKQGKTKMDS